MTSYLSENEAENPQNGDVHLTQIRDFEMGYLENHLALRSVMARFFFLFHFSRSFIFVDRSFPLTQVLHTA